MCACGRCQKNQSANHVGCESILISGSATLGISDYSDLAAGWWEGFLEGCVRVFSASASLLGCDFRGDLVIIAAVVDGVVSATLVQSLQ